MDPEESDVPSRSGQSFRHDKVVTAMEFDDDRVRLEFQVESFKLKYSIHYYNARYNNILI